MTQALRRYLRRCRFCCWLGLVWRRDAYFHQSPTRWTFREAWFVAGVIAQTCRSIQDNTWQAARC